MDGNILNIKKKTKAYLIIKDICFSNKQVILFITSIITMRLFDKQNTMYVSCCCFNIRPLYWKSLSNNTLYSQQSAVSALCCFFA